MFQVSSLPKLSSESRSLEYDQTSFLWVERVDSQGRGKKLDATVVGAAGAVWSSVCARKPQWMRNSKHQHTKSGSSPRLYARPSVLQFEHEQQCFCLEDQQLHKIHWWHICGAAEGDRVTEFIDPVSLVPVGRIRLLPVSFTSNKDTQKSSLSWALLVIKAVYGLFPRWTVKHIPLILI